MKNSIETVRCCAKFLLMWGLIAAHGGVVIMAFISFVVAVVAS